MGKQEKMTDKVAKLLRQAEDVVGTPEEAVFMAKAFEIMAKYGLEMSTVRATKQGLDMSDMADAVEWKVVINSGKYIAAQAMIIFGMARAMHCKTVYSSSSGQTTVWVYGMESHVERMQFLWELLRPQALRLVDKVRPEGQDTSPSRMERRYNYRTCEYEYKRVRQTGQLRRYRTAWIAGFANAVESRITEQEAKAVESGGSAALVLYKSDEQRAKDALARAHPRVRTVRRRGFDGGGYAHGQRDGRDAAFSRSLSA